MQPSYTRVKWACYTASLSMSAVLNLSPMLFLTFRTQYGISYTLLGLLVLINFVTQLTVDLMFSFFSHKIDMAKAVKLTPILTVTGLLIYAVSPFLFPRATYAGLVLGTVIFSAAGGFVEVLLTPVIAAIPAKDPDREISKLHSVYAWGTVGVVLISAAYLALVGTAHWPWLALAWSIIPLISVFLFWGAKIPHMDAPEKASGICTQLKNRALWGFFLTIFLAGAAECTMSQWASGYVEEALGLPKIFGDVFGIAAFALAMGLGRTLYAKYGKSMETVLVLGGIGTTVCYLCATLVPSPIVGLLACGLTGFCVSMLWPGTIIVATEHIPTGGVFLFAMMAAGGDLGASVGPQLIGSITDAAIANPRLLVWADALGLAPEQLGMKLGMLIATLFPLAATAIFVGFLKKKQKKEIVAQKN